MFKSGAYLEQIVEVTKADCVAILEILSPEPHIPKPMRVSEAIATTYVQYRAVKVVLSTDTDSDATVIKKTPPWHINGWGLLDDCST